MYPRYYSSILIYYLQIVTSLGGFCTEDADCEVNVAKCEDLECVCQPDFVLSFDGEKCLPVAVYGGSCQESVQCEKTLGIESTCFNNTCHCEKGHHYQNNFCHDSNQIGEICLSNYECVEGKSTPSLRTECRKGFCACKQEYTYNAENQICSGSPAWNPSPFLHVIILLLHLAVARTHTIIVNL